MHLQLLEKNMQIVH